MNLRHTKNGAIFWATLYNQLRGLNCLRLARVTLFTSTHLQHIYKLEITSHLKHFTTLPCKILMSLFEY